MKINELHLRNIASIEKADIDFENGLNDCVTGAPASIFLISGDTGAGKSVILDGISMALYKNTPRIAGVANVNRNEFTDAQGESIRVGSIEQYTRLGISDKDECYSEVAFIGNDGVDYHARLSLGMTLGAADKVTNIRPLKHRSPKWEVKVGNGDWTKDNVEQTILNAVGLTFSQFGRMAMLAQGQFAAFLTGDKKEREAILEQLTNTEHFSMYGKAIKSLFDKAKKDMALAKATVDAEATHPLPQEKVDKLLEEKKKLTDEKAGLEKKDTANEETLALVSTIENNRATADREEAERLKLAETAAGAQYKGYKALISDWDATSTERQRLSDLKSAEAGLAAVNERINVRRDTFMLLSADLEARREALRAQGDPQKAVDAKQAEIDALTEQRNALNPKAVNDELSSLSARKSLLATVATREKGLQDDTQAANDLEREINKEETALDAYKKEQDAAQSVHDVAKAKADDANKRYATMSTGIQEAMKGIRRRLVEEHAETCPLCGQHINEIHLDEEFKDMLTSFEKEQREAADALEEADRSLNSAKSAYNKSYGAIQSKRSELERKRKAVETGRKKLEEDTARLGIDISKSPAEQIASASKAVEERENELHAIQKQIEAIQDRITENQNGKKPLDQVLRKFNDDSQIVRKIEDTRDDVLSLHPDWDTSVVPKEYPCEDIAREWNKLHREASADASSAVSLRRTIEDCTEVLGEYCTRSGKTVADLAGIAARKDELGNARIFVKSIDENLKSRADAVSAAEGHIREALERLGVAEEKDVPGKQALLDIKSAIKAQNEEIVGRINIIETQLEANEKDTERLAKAKAKLRKATELFNKWNILNGYFGGTRFRTLVQTHILRPLLNNANIYLTKITDRYTLTCSEDNEQLSILVLDNYNKGQIRSVTVLSGGERFMISLALSLALSSMNRPDMNVNILFIDEGFGTLDEKNLDSVMETLEKLQAIAGQSERRVGIISHREELNERIPVRIQVKKKGEGRSHVDIFHAS